MMLVFDGSYTIGQALTVWVLEQDLSINSTRSDEGRIERLDLVSSHDDFDIAAVIETVELIEKLQHSTLDLALAAGR